MGRRIWRWCWYHFGLVWCAHSFTRAWLLLMNLHQRNSRRTSRCRLRQRLISTELGMRQQLGFGLCRSDRTALWVLVLCCMHWKEWKIWCEVHSYWDVLLLLTQSFANVDCHYTPDQLLSGNEHRILPNKFQISIFTFDALNNNLYIKIKLYCLHWQVLWRCVGQQNYCWGTRDLLQISGSTLYAVWTAWNDTRANHTRTNRCTCRTPLHQIHL